MKQDGFKRNRKKWPVIILVIVLLGIIWKITSEKNPDPYKNSVSLNKPISTTAMPLTTFQTADPREVVLLAVQTSSFVVNTTPAVPLTTQTSTFVKNTTPITQAPSVPVTVLQLPASELERIDGVDYRKGSSGAGVRQIQEWLIALQYLPVGENDGKYGSKTASAVNSFQAKEGLTASGTATIATQYRLAQKAATFITTSRGAHKTGTDDYGIVTWDDSSFYIGTFRDNAIEGKGTFYFAGGHYYVGAFDDGCRDGKGEMSFSNGDFYTGEWKDDLMEGNGTYYFGRKNSTEQYIGKWAHGTMTGSGTYTLSDGRKIKGTWSNNSFVQ